MQELKEKKKKFLNLPNKPKHPSLEQSGSVTGAEQLNKRKRKSTHGYF